MSQNEKILIAEVADNIIWYDFFPFYSHVWLVRANNIYTDIADPDFELENIGLEGIYLFRYKKKSIPKFQQLQM
jgi:hypothetical protein